MWEVDRMLLREDITLDEHAVIENFIHDVHNLRLFGIPPQSMEVRSHSGIPSSGTMREAIAWKKLTKIREGFKKKSLRLDTEMMDLALDSTKTYDIPLVKVGAEFLTEFYQNW